MSKEIFYEVHVDWKNGRTGELSSPDLPQTIECATPPDFPGGVPGIWSPEHLFVAAINSCYMATFLAIAHNMKLEITRFHCRTVAKLEMIDGRYLITTAEMCPEVKLLEPDKDTEKAMRILEKSKTSCLVTNSMKTEVLLNSSVM